MNETKVWWKSWTIWFNVAVFAVGAVNQLAQIVPLSPVVLADVAVIGNILLRIKTVMGIGLTSDQG